MTKVSLFQQHCECWKDGCGASICEGARKVFSRGKLPCDVLFVGEAPGESEDTVGLPFIGPAGKLLDHIVKQAIPSTLRVAFTNIVCCIPREEDGRKATEPDDDSILACQPRLVEFVEIAKPKLIVCVGAMARDWLSPGYAHSAPIPRSIPRIDVTHPAAILRASIAMKGLLVQKVVANLRNAVEEYFPGVE
jgi:uracil-DNA glycosylase family 4